MIFISLSLTGCFLKEDALQDPLEPLFSLIFEGNEMKIYWENADWSYLVWGFLPVNKSSSFFTFRSSITR